MPMRRHKGGGASGDGQQRRTEPKGGGICVSTVGRSEMQKVHVLWWVGVGELCGHVVDMCRRVLGGGRVVGKSLGV